MGVQFTRMEAKKPNVKCHVLPEARSWTQDLANEMDLPEILELVMLRPGQVENSLVVCSGDSRGHFPGVEVMVPGQLWVVVTWGWCDT